MSHLPAELLSHIFIYTPSFSSAVWTHHNHRTKSLLSLLLVCKTWHLAARSTIQLWDRVICLSYILGGDPRDYWLAKTRRYLDYLPRDWGLFIVIGWTAQHKLPKMMGLLEEISDRIEELRDDGGFLTKQFSVTSKSLYENIKLPRLAHLHVKRSPEINGRRESIQTVPLFTRFHQCASLSKFTFGRFDDFWNQSRTRILTEFFIYQDEIPTVQEIVYSQIDLYLGNFRQQCLAVSESLKTLTLDKVAWCSSNPNLSHSIDDLASTIVLPQLEKLILTASRKNGALDVEMFNAILLGCPKLHHLSVHNIGPHLSQNRLLPGSTYHSRGLDRSTSMNPTNRITQISLMLASHSNGTLKFISMYDYYTRLSSAVRQTTQWIRQFEGLERITVDSRNSDGHWEGDEWLERVKPDIGVVLRSLGKLLSNPTPRHTTLPALCNIDVFSCSFTPSDLYSLVNLGAVRGSRQIVMTIKDCVLIPSPSRNADRMKRSGTWNLRAIPDLELSLDGTDRGWEQLERAVSDMGFSPDSTEKAGEPQIWEDFVELQIEW